jgi:hypothetical protein
MTSKRATETGDRLEEIFGKLDALERRLDDVEDQIEHAWDRIVAPPPAPSRSTESEFDRSDHG